MPDFKEEIKKQLAALNLRPMRENEIVEELSQHLEDQYEQLLSRGASEEEAYRATVEGLDENELLARELTAVERRPHDEGMVAGGGKANLLGDLWQDLRYGLRTLLKNPGFTIVAVAALALGIGANSAIFSVVDNILLRPLPYTHPEQLVMVWENATHLGFPKNTPSPANFLDWRRQNSVFDGMAAMAWASYNLTGSGEPERLDGRRVTANLFSLLGVQPTLGRPFSAEEDAPGSHVVILSHSLWQRRFGSDPQIIGRRIILNAQAYTVVGVMPATVELPGLDGDISWSDQLWVPMAFTNEEAARRGDHYLDVIGRMKPGMTLEKARAEMDTIAARLARQYPEENLRIGTVVVPLQEQLVGAVKPALLVLLGAVAFVLLIACANVANLLLARAAAREKEVGLRLALGATRSRLTRQFLTESLLLAVIGGAAGLGLAAFGVDVLRRFVPASIPRADSIAIDAKVLLFGMGVSLVTGLVFGLFPALRASKLVLNDSLKEGGRDASGGAKGNRLRGWLVIAEVAISFVLLIGAGLLISSFQHLRNLDPGFQPDHLLTMKVDLSEIRYPNRERRVAFFEEILRRVQALSGVKSVAVAGNLPLTYNGDSMPIGVEGIPDPPPDQRADVIYRAVGPGYFSTMGIPLLRGRDFTDTDRADTKYTVVVSQKTAEHFWPGANPIGKRLKPGSSTSDAPWREVIGVVKDVRQNDFLAPPKMQMYFSYRQLRDLAPNALIVRTTVPPLTLAGSVRSEIWTIDKDQTVADIDTMENIVARAVARQRFSMLLLGLFAGLALLLAAVGIYGVMSYSVVQRTREIGIRMALGAQRRDVLGMTLRQGLRLVGIGVGLGIAGALVLTRLMSSLLFGVSATDPITFAAITLVLTAVALVASYIPALRATRVDPMLALRYQ